MSIKLKALGLAVVAALAVSAVASMSASATGTGHFTSEVDHVIVHGTDEGTNNKFTDPNLPAITCEEATYEGTLDEADTTATEITIFATYGDCHTSAGDAHVAMNGCHYTFTIETHSETTDNQAHLVCPGATKHVTIRATNFAGSCTITIPAQTAGGGVSYTTGGAAGSTHDITVDVTGSSIDSVRHADGFGACLFASTNEANGGLTGEATVKGKDTAGNQVGITATGSTGA